MNLLEPSFNNLMAVSFIQPDNELHQCIAILVITQTVWWERQPLVRWKWHRLNWQLTPNLTDCLLHVILWHRPDSHYAKKKKKTQQLQIFWLVNLYVMTAFTTGKKAQCLKVRQYIRKERRQVVITILSIFISQCLFWLHTGIFPYVI